MHMYPKRTVSIQAGLLATLLLSTPGAPVDADILWLESSVSRGKRMELGVLPLSSRARDLLDSRQLRVSLDGRPARLLSVRPREQPFHLVLTLEHTRAALTDREAQLGALADLLEQLPLQSRASAVLFGDRIQVMEARAGKLGALRARLEGSAPTGVRARLGEAVERALTLAARGNTPRSAVVILSWTRDPELAKDPWKRRTPRQQLLQRARTAGVPIHGFSLGAEADRELLAALASESGGLSAHCWSGLSLSRSLGRLTEGLAHPRRILVEDPSPGVGPRRALTILSRPRKSRLLSTRFTPRRITPRPALSPTPTATTAAAVTTTATSATAAAPNAVSTSASTSPVPTKSAQAPLPTRLSRVPRFDLGGWPVGGDGSSLDGLELDLLQRIEIRLGLLDSHARSSLMPALDRLEEARTQGGTQESVLAIRRFHDLATKALSFLGSTYSGTMKGITEDIASFERQHPDHARFSQENRAQLVALRGHWADFKRLLEEWGRTVPGEAPAGAR